MAGRPRIIRNIQSYVNHIDANTFSGPMKMGTSPSIGVTRNYWYNYQTQCNQNPNAVKKSYKNMVFLNINPASTPVSAGFCQSNPQSNKPSLFQNFGTGLGCGPSGCGITKYESKQMLGVGKMARMYN
jgi:hypothetical protein